jgi:hypothetical protein
LFTSLFIFAKDPDIDIIKNLYYFPRILLILPLILSTFPRSPSFFFIFPISKSIIFTYPSTVNVYTEESDWE